MIILPAIDIRHGKCVRLVQGRDDAVKEYSSDPVRMALHWEQEGAEWLHVVDLDAAITGSMENNHLIETILEGVRIPVQLGGGIRTLERIEECIVMGASRIVLGTAAVENPPLLQEAVKRHGDYLAVGIDVKNGHIATRGWKSETDSEAATFAKRLALHGVRTFVVTDIAQDGMLTGPNYALTDQIASVTRASVILSGGIGSLEDLSRARALEERGVDGIIIGKALYENRLTLKQARAVTAKLRRDLPT
jgi:phosphoribosylformimino-5-aminoimidazole carboxamide ribotide isomerase